MEKKPMSGPVSTNTIKRLLKYVKKSSENIFFFFNEVFNMCTEDIKKVTILVKL